MAWIRKGGAAILVALLALISSIAAGAVVTVFAAASLKEAMDDQAKQFEARTGNKVVIAYGASNALARQIEAGAPADAFISADLDWMDYVDQKRLLMAGTRANLLRNALVLIAPASSKAALKIGPGFGLAAASARRNWRWPIPTACRQESTARPRSKTRRMGERRKAGRSCGKRARRAGTGVARRGAVRIVYSTDALSDKGVRIVDSFPPTAIRRSCIPRRSLQRASPARARRCSIICARRRNARPGKSMASTRSVIHVRAEPGRSRHPALSLRVAAVSVVCSLPLAYSSPTASPVFISRQDARRRDRASAAGAAAGRRRLCAAGAVRQARSHRQRALRLVRNRVCVPLDRRGPGVRADGLPADGRAIRLSIEAIDQRLEVAARTLGASRIVGVRVDHAAAGASGDHHRDAVVVRARLGEFGATITFVSNIPGETQTLPLAIYTFTQVTGRRCAGAAAEHHRGDPVDRGAVGFRVAHSPLGTDEWR
jgi:molybdate transport system substrate-binding protein